MRTRLALSLLVLVAIATGCETSKGFQTGVEAGAPRIAKYADEYVVADTHLDQPTHDARIAQLTAFKLATSAPIKFRPVYDAWSGVRPWFMTYSANDAELRSDPSKAMLRTEMTSAFDKVVESERQRRAIWFPFDTPAPIAK